MGEPQPEDFADRSRILGHVWYSSIVGWVNGRTDLAWVHGEMAVAVRPLLGESSATGLSATPAPEAPVPETGAS
jgi:hypothetical protein